MAIKNLAFPELLRYPNWGCYEGGSVSVSGITIDAAGEYLGNVFSIPRSGSITKIHFGVDPVTISGDLDCRIETLNDSTGLPTGTLWDTNTNALITVSAAGLNTATLTAPASVTQGQNIAVLVKADVSSVPTLQILRYSDTAPCFPYRFYDLGSLVKDATNLMCIWVEYSDQIQPNIPWMRRLISDSTSTIMTNDVRYGLRFQLPFDAKISGWWTQNDYSDNANNTVEIYGSDGVQVMKTATVNGNIRQAGPSPCYHLFSTDFEAKARTWYRLTWRTSDNTGAARYYVDIPDISETTQFGGHDFITDDGNLTQPVHYTYTSAAAAPTKEDDWINDYGQVTPMGVLISEISEWEQAAYSRFRRGRSSR